jgi:hypothetical protein
VTNATTVGGPLTVKGLSTLNTLNATGAVNCATSAGVTNNLAVGGNVSVGGDIACDNVTVTNAGRMLSLAVTNAITAGGSMTAVNYYNDGGDYWLRTNGRFTFVSTQLLYVTIEGVTNVLDYDTSTP